MLPIVGATIAGSGAGGFLSGIGGIKGLAGAAGGLLSGLGGLFGGDDDSGVDYNVMEDMRKWTNEDWLFQNEKLREWQNKDFWRNRELGIADAKLQGVRLRQAAKQGGFNPLTMLSAASGMPGAVGGGGGAVASPAGIPPVISPGARSGNAFQAVGDILSAFEQSEKVQDQLEIERLEDEVETLKGGFDGGQGAQPVYTKPMTEVTSPEFANATHKTGEELWVTADGKTRTESAAVFDQDGMPLEAETEAFGALERGQIGPWAMDLLRRNTEDSIQYGHRKATEERNAERKRKEEAKQAYEEFNERLRRKDRKRDLFQEDLERHYGTRWHYPPL